MTAALPAATAGDPEDDEIADDNPLTTKEGWRQFVDTEPSPPSMLDDTALAGLGAADRTAYDEARIDYHAGLPLVNTPVIRQVISTSRLLIQLNRHQVSARRGVVISGASGTGKTTARRQLGRAHELAGRKRHPDDPRRLPVVYITVPPAATPRMVAVEFARFLGLPTTRSANLTDVTNAVCATAARTSVDLVLVDEIHNISLATRTRGGSVGHAEVLRGMAACHLRVRGPGRGRDRPVRRHPGPADRRPVHPHPVPPFCFGTAEQKATWRSLVAAMEASLRLHSHKPGTLTGLGEYLFSRTGGAIGSLSQLVRGVAVLAIEDGAEQVTGNCSTWSPSTTPRSARPPSWPGARPGPGGERLAAAASFGPSRPA